MANYPNLHSFKKFMVSLTLLYTGSEMSGYSWGGRLEDNLYFKPLQSILGGSNGHVAL